MKRLFYLSLLAIYAIYLSSCQKQPESTLSINLHQEPTSLDPVFSRNLSSLFLARHLHEGLFRFNNEELENALCDHYDVNEECTKYTFFLKKAQYHDGEFIQASDFADSLQRALKQDSRADYAHLLYVIKNAEKVKKGICEIEELGFRVLSDSSFEVSLEYPCKNLPELFTHPVFFPTKIKQGKFCFSGPFCLDDYQLAQHIKLKKNPKYFDEKKVHLQSITGYFLNHDTAFALFQKNKLHFIGSPLGMIPQEVLPRLEQKKQLMKKDWLGVCFIRVNTQKNLLSKVSVRQKLTNAIDRLQIAKNGLQGHHTPTGLFVPQNLLPSHDDLPKITQQDLDSCQLSETITLKFSQADQRMQTVACLLKTQLAEKLGIDIQLVPRESKMLLQDMIEKNYDLAISTWMADTKDPENFLGLFFDKKTVVNGTDWEDPGFQDCLIQAHKDIKSQDNFYREAQNILITQSPIIPLFQFNMLYAKDEKLEDVSLNSLGILDFKRAKL